MIEFLMLIVLDTNVFVAATRNRNGASFRLLELLPQDIYAYLLSVPLFLEYESVLKREEQLLVSQLTIQDVDVLLDMIAAHAKTIDRISYLWRPQLSDPKDEMVLELAINGNAQAIVTFNQKDFNKITPLFNLQVMTPSRFLKQLQGNSHV